MDTDIVDVDIHGVDTGIDIDLDLYFGYRSSALQK